MAQPSPDTPCDVRSGPPVPDPATPLRQALGVAVEHWAERPGDSVMRAMATKCVVLLEEAGYGSTDLASLRPRHGVKLLAALRGASLSPKSVSSYYGAFKRMLGLAEVACVGWPKAPTPPRRTRDRLSEDNTSAIIAWLDAKGWATTGDLGRLLRATGLRDQVEALNHAHLELREGEKYDVLHVTGKGGHERLIPVVAEDARALLRDPERLAAMRAHSYEGHLQRWKKAVAFLGVQSRLATPHAVRHGYASDVLEKSGGNLKLVQELLGHADPGTTAKYISVNLAAKAMASPGASEANEP
jgi:site-specific recombinase XerC